MPGVKPFEFKRYTTYAGISEQCCAQRPVAQFAEFRPSTAQAAAWQHAMGEYHRSFVTIQKDFAQHCGGFRTQAGHYSFVLSRPAGSLAYMTHTELRAMPDDASRKRPLIGKPVARGTVNTDQSGTPGRRIAQVGHDRQELSKPCHYATLHTPD